MSTEPSISQDKEFGRIRAILWPIHNYELKKLLPMLIMFACIAFSYSALRSTKDSGVMQNASGQLTAAAIPLLKVGLVLPCAMLGKSLYNFLRYRFSDQKTFYALISGFMFFFPLFAFVLHPLFENHRIQRKVTQNQQVAVTMLAQGTVDTNTAKLLEKFTQGRDTVSATEQYAIDKIISEHQRKQHELLKKEQGDAQIAPSSSAITRFFSGIVSLLEHLWYALTLNFDNTSFYIMSELWGSIALSLLFWGFANVICNINETTRFYPLLGFFANVATTGVASLHPQVQRLFKFFTGLEHGKAHALYDAFFLKTLAVITFILGGVILGCYYYLQTQVLTDPRFYTPTKSTKKKMKSQGLMAGLRYIWSDPYLRNICFIVVAYGFVSQIVEVVYKEQLSLYFDGILSGEHFNTYDDRIKAKKMAINAFTASITSGSGAIAAFMGLVGAGNIIRRMGWTFSASVTPVIMLITGALSLGSATFPEFCRHLLGIDPCTLGVWLGAFQLVTSKGTKYTLFDSTKEMAYIPLDPESKNRAKAEIDVVGSRFGKAGGSFYNSAIIALFGGAVLSIAPVSLALLLGFGGYWCTATSNLGQQFKRKLALREKEEESSLKKA